LERAAKSQPQNVVPYLSTVIKDIRRRDENVHYSDEISVDMISLTDIRDQRSKTAIVDAGYKERETGADEFEIKSGGLKIRCLYFEWLHGV
jgi:hypothetical protein